MSKIKHFLFISNVFLCFLSLPSSPTQAMDEIETSYAIGQRGVRFYEEGEYHKASPLLRRALEDGEMTVAHIYADLCHRDLDHGKHRPQEAALWYVRAAEVGDGDALSYLRSLSLDFLGDDSEEQKTQRLVHIWAIQDANTGYALYVAEKFAEAAKPLKRASIGNHPLAQQLYGDICLRQLDGKPHSYLEAAMWYLLSAQGGDPQSLSYLKSIIPHILEEDNYESQMRAIVGCWVMHETLPNLKPLKPGKVNNYLIFKHGREIDKTTAQKLPYLFERVTSAIMYRLTGRAHSVIDDQLSPQADDLEVPSEIRRCALTVPTLVANQFVGHRLSACVYGPVYMNYFKSLDTQLVFNPQLKKKVLKMPPNLPEILPIYEMLLDALHESTKRKRAKELVDLSHHDYPWLWAGIMFWKEKHHEPFNFTSLSEDELLRKLTAMSERIPEKDITIIRHHIEPESNWPNDDDHSVCRSFHERMHAYFTSTISREAEVVRTTENLFYTRLRQHNLDCSETKDRQILKTPFFMSYCRTLILSNVSSAIYCYQALQEGQRYFDDLELSIALSADFKSESATGKNIIKLLDKLKKRGIRVTIKNARKSE